jgi:hypothetical protein
VLLDVREQNKRLQADLNRIQLENQYLRSGARHIRARQALIGFPGTIPR